jgi:hypothetical protein
MSSGLPLGSRRSRHGIPDVSAQMLPRSAGLPGWCEGVSPSLLSIGHDFTPTGAEIPLLICEGYPGGQR